MPKGDQKRKPGKRTGLKSEIVFESDELGFKKESFQSGNRVIDAFFGVWHGVAEIHESVRQLSVNGQKNAPSKNSGKGKNGRKRYLSLSVRRTQSSCKKSLFPT